MLGDSCYLVIGEERCIDVMPRDAFEEMASELMRQARNKEISLNRQRALAHSAALVTLDKQGRVASRVLGEIQKGTLKALITAAVAE